MASHASCFTMKLAACCGGFHARQTGMHRDRDDKVGDGTGRGGRSPDLKAAAPASATRCSALRRRGQGHLPDQPVVVLGADHAHRPLA